MTRTLAIAVALFAAIAAAVAVATAPEPDLDAAQAALVEERGRLSQAADRSRSASQRLTYHRALLAEYQRTAAAAAAQLASDRRALEEAHERLAVAQGRLEAAHAALDAARAADHARRLSAAVAAIPDDQPAAAALRRQAARIVYQANEHEATTDDIERADDRLDHQIHALISAIALDQETASETRKAANRARTRAAYVEEVARNIRAQAAALSR